MLYEVITIFKVADAQLNLKDLDLPFGATEGVKLAALQVAGVRFDSGENRLDVADIDLKDGRLIMSQSPEGRLSYLDLLREPEAAAAPETAASPSKTEAAKLV